MPNISVIMPAFNAEKYISEAIESILQQTFTDFELLICDDGSTDDTLSIIKDYSQKDRRIRYFENKQNIGNLKTTNFLFEQCKGEYLTIQDADDYSNLKRFETLLSMFETDSGLGIVGGNYEIVNSNKESICCGLLPLTNEEIKCIMSKEVIPMLYAGVMLKSEVLDKVGMFRLFFNRIGSADMDWLNRCGEKYKVQNSKEILYYYRKHDDSFSSLYYNKLEKRKSLLLNNMHLLLVNAHTIRIAGGIDYFKENDKIAMKKFISLSYIKKAESLYWEGNLNEAFNKLYVAFKANPLNIKVYKTFFYITRNYRSKK